LITDFGKIMDPIADKAMTGAALIMLSVWEYVPWWMTILILVREIGITVMRFTILKYGALPANLAGKAKTMVQTIAITFCLIPFEVWWSPARWIGLALMALRGADRLVRTGEPQGRPAAAPRGPGRRRRRPMTGTGTDASDSADGVDPADVIRRAGERGWMLATAES